jgi:hypothetical protein
MKTPPLPILIAIALLLASGRIMLALEASESNVFLPLGIAGLGCLTLASERWRHIADTAEPTAPVHAHEGAAVQQPEASTGVGSERALSESRAA